MITKLFATVSIIYCLCFSFISYGQITENFDGSAFTLSPNSFYKNTTKDDWQTSLPTSFATFRYHWDTAYGGYWKSGLAYTNIKDSVNGTFTNLYGSITNGAFNGSNYVTAQRNSIIKMNSSALSLSGFFVTNTTYAYKTIKKGNAFARKFGDTTGTHSGLAQGTYPDWFKLIVRPYRGGVLLTDSVEFYLADYRPAGTSNDEIVKNWQYVNCSKLPISDSILITMKSSDNGLYGMNTPGFFCMDNITVINTIGMQELENLVNMFVSPNPASDNISLQYVAKLETMLTVKLYDIYGKEIMTMQSEAVIGSNNILLQTSYLSAGVYFLEINEGTASKKIKFVKL